MGNSVVQRKAPRFARTVPYLALPHFTILHRAVPCPPLAYRTAPYRIVQRGRTDTSTPTNGYNASPNKRCQSPQSWQQATACAEGISAPEKNWKRLRDNIYVKFIYAQGLCHWITFPPGFRLFYRKEEETDEKRKQFPTQEISQRAIDQERTDFRQKLGTKIRKISKYNPPENNRNIFAKHFSTIPAVLHIIYTRVYSSMYTWGTDLNGNISTVGM